MQISNQTLPKKLLILTLVLICYLLGMYSLKAQYSESYQSQTILKVYQNQKTPFNKSQLRWINNRGFDIYNYDWDNANVNKTLKQAIKSRNTSRAFLIIGPILTYLSMIAIIVPAVDDDPNSEPSPVAVASFATGGLMFFSSFAINLNARSKVKKAHNIRFPLSK